jgi:mannosylglycerate hydrolase
VPGTIRLDVGLGERPVPPQKLADDQRQVERLLGEAERFKVVLHASGTTRRVLVQASPAVDNGFVPITVEAGSGTAGAGKHERGIFAGNLRVSVEEDGALQVEDGARSFRVELSDEGDRGDLYHFDPVAGEQPAHPRLKSWRVTEEGPLRARLVIDSELELPLGLNVDRARRSDEKRLCLLSTEVTLTAGERRVELATTFTNDARDHRLRALCTLPFAANRIDADQGLAVVERPLEATSLGAGAERPAPTGQHQRFVDVSDGRRGLALFSRGLPEHEVRTGKDSTVLALTLLRAVGWLARGDLSCVDHAVGPMVETPGAEEPGLHRFEWALYPHEGDWTSALAESRRYQAPPLAVGGGVTAPLGRGLLEVSPSTVTISAVYPSKAGVVVRVLNASDRPAEAVFTPAVTPRTAHLVDPLERPLQELPMANGKLRLTLGAWQLATILLAQ